VLVGLKLDLDDQLASVASFSAHCWLSHLDNKTVSEVINNMSSGTLSLYSLITANVG